MKRAEQNAAITAVIERLADAESIVNDCMHILEENHLKRYSAKLDTISGKLCNLGYALFFRTKYDARTRAERENHV